MRARRLVTPLAFGAAAVLAAPAADATLFRLPTTCAGGCSVVTNYLDYGGVRDYACGRVTYPGHRGTDYAILGGFAAMDAGRDIVAGADGEVVGTNDGEFDRCTTGGCPGGAGFGNYVILRHADGKQTIHGHMKRFSVEVAVGDVVSCGDKLGEVGSSGNSTGPHLHFEVRVGGAPDDPYQGACSGPLTYWVAQGGYRGLPGTDCE